MGNRLDESTLSGNGAEMGRGKETFSLSVVTSSLEVQQGKIARRLQCFYIISLSVKSTPGSVTYFLTIRDMKRRTGPSVRERSREERTSTMNFEIAFKACENSSPEARI